ncbi:MAG: L-serine ammonia-lyase, iron-sulfur-dependent, subunit alpha [Proteobacteria bacterium]|nr:L-serine ammonia-lyase, iron-sulfur-dependent, subunit alpha [Pseudomonadota bacterium]MBU1581207.1 L-serine ammonia-lyase, iron-sulfur-dependent, subunit alpha [Pseudomonadota bacterium]MBU2453069.1 L-serine ammonia-lyase, iron-sulfur-dependent, subunit alpha [Pseudomonadota bacterium]MBU2629041.1 L-serine ammonia-lyase, iron-sulfur-dependent, subunit alpha [Pseudomonadota bacterium]
MDKDERQKIIALIHREVVPALGCTEPVAVALATARAREVLGVFPETIEVFVSGNIYKNGMGVGIPGTGMVGLPVAAALGAVCGASKDGLEVLKQVSQKSLETANQMLSEKKVKITVKDGTDKLYVESIVTANGHTCRVIISHRHTNIIYVEKNGKSVFKATPARPDVEKPTGENNLSVAKVIEFADQTPLEEIRFILEGARLNEAISKEGMTGNYGLKTGITIKKNIARKYIAEDLVSHAMSITAAASDARMDGCTLPVMSNSGSGNQGITTILPVVAVARKTGASEEKLIRALILSNLMAIYIKQFIGQLTALCGILTAATGAACGICYLLGGNLNQISGTIKNMTASITGMICDGAKLGCAIKVSSGVSAAVYCALLAMEGINATQTDGIIDEDVELTVRNIGTLATKGMRETDLHIINTMISNRQ